MATNFQLLSSSASSNSSSSDDSDGLPNDKKLDLSYHELDDSSLAVNLQDFSQNQMSRLRIEKLFLYNNILEGIPHTVTEMTNLTLLDISNNLLRTVPQSLCSLVNLTHLYLRNNEIGEEDLPKDMRGLIKLRDLNLSGNRLRSLPPSLFHLEGLRNLFLGANQLVEVAPEIKVLKRLKVLYLGGNFLTHLPAEICQLQHLNALILAQNRLRSLPNCICNLKRLKCLQLHQNELTTLPHDLVFLNSLTELSLRDNPLVMRFVREMAFQPSSLLELSARVVKNSGVHYTEDDIPHELIDYLRGAQCCVNPRCRGVYFDTRVEHVKFVDFCGMYKIPLMQYLCSSHCSTEAPAVDRDSPHAEECTRMKKVLLG